MHTPTVGIILHVTAPEGGGEALAAFLRDTVPKAAAEEGTLTWMVLRSSETAFHIIDTFTDDAARQVHVAGVIAQDMYARGEQLFASRPEVITTDVIAMMPAKGNWTLPAEALPTDR